MTRLVICSLVGLVACGDNRGAQLPDGSSATDDSGGSSAFAGIAVVNSDYVSTSISLLDPVTGMVKNGNCINSGTHTPGNTLALSGDVGLPSAPQPMHLLVTIDHANSALTWIDPSKCTPLRQLDVSTGFYANPHDLVAVSETKAYVTRYEKNATPTASTSDFDEGDDVLIIDPSVPKIIGRIDMSAYAVTVANATIQARPSSAQLVGDKLYVMLENLSGNFMAAAHGRLVIIDTTTDKVTGTVDVTFKNCGGLSYVEATHTLIASCGGSFNDADQMAGSGVAYIDVAASPPAVTHTVPASAFGRALAGFSGIARDGALGFGVTFGEFGGTPKDQFWALDAAAGTTKKLADASDSFTYGSVLVDPPTQHVFLTDAAANMPRVHLYSYEGEPELKRSIDANPSVGLPPRQLAWF
jgi:hypothetical protein